MSYIVSGTTIPDPYFAIAGMDLLDLTNIYKLTIGNYFNTNYKAQLYYKQTDGIEIKENKYTMEDVVNFICYHYQAGTTNVISVVPLFFYLSCVSENWTLEINFESELNSYLNQYTGGEFKDFLNDLTENYSFDLFPGLKIFKENSLSQEEEGQVTMPEDASLLDWFLLFWKNGCVTDIVIPNKTILSTSGNDFNEEQQQRYDSIQEMIQNNPEIYEVYDNGSIYDKSANIWLVGGNING